MILTSNLNSGTYFYNTQKYIIKTEDKYATCENCAIEIWLQWQSVLHYHDTAHDIITFIIFDHRLVAVWN